MTIIYRYITHAGKQPKKIYAVTSNSGKIYSGRTCIVCTVRNQMLQKLCHHHVFADKDFTWGCQLRQYGRDDARIFSCTMQWIYYLQFMLVWRDGRSPNPNEELKSRTVAEPESNISTVLLHGKGQKDTQCSGQGNTTKAGMSKLSV